MLLEGFLETSRHWRELQGVTALQPHEEGREVVRPWAPLLPCTHGVEESTPVSIQTQEHLTVHVSFPWAAATVTLYRGLGFAV